MAVTPLRTSALAFCLFVSVLSADATNLLTNGSFEQGLNAWLVSGVAIVATNTSTCDGTNNVLLKGSIAQSITTRPLATYAVRYWNNQVTPIAVRFGEQVYTFPQPPIPFPGWRQYEVFLIASAAVTRVEFINLRAEGTRLDLLEVIDTAEPVRIVTQPESRSVYDGGTVALRTVVDGGPPLYLQWFFNGTPVAGATGATLVFTNTQLSQGGSYRLEVSNAVSSAWSLAATVSVQILPEVPIITGQPVGDTLASGYALALQVTALGAAPLAYEWRRDGVPLTNETGPMLVFPAIDATATGEYTVRVANQHGSVLSLPASVVVTNSTGGGVVVLNNQRVGAPVYNVDGSRVGRGYSAQLYAAPSPGVLRPVGAPVPSSGGGAGGYFWSRTVALPDVAPGETVFVQMRAWESSWGGTYEDARARGGRYGASTVQSMIAGTNGNGVLYAAVTSFALRAGDFLFTTGLLSAAGRGPQHEVSWRLVGEPGFTYLVERRAPPKNWFPLLLVTNQTGTVTFTDPDPQNNAVTFYRARLLD